MCNLIILYPANDGTKMRIAQMDITNRTLPGGGFVICGAPLWYLDSQADTQPVNARSSSIVAALSATFLGAAFPEA